MPSSPRPRPSNPSCRPPVSGKDGWWYAKAIGIGLGLPTAILLLAEGVPALRQWRRDRRLELWGKEGKAARGYFRLTPYERQDQDQFHRADGAQDQILAWLRRENGPTISYLSGRSGAGKSSLLLTSLDLSYNGLTALPPEVSKLTALTSLNLGGNKLTDPPPEVVKQGTPAILAYLRKKLDSTPGSGGR